MPCKKGFISQLSGNFQPYPGANTKMLMKGAAASPGLSSFGEKQHLGCSLIILGLLDHQQHLEMFFPTQNTKQQIHPLPWALRCCAQLPSLISRGFCHSI